MTIIYAIILLIITGFLGGLIYLIYFPIKKYLLKSGKLSVKLNRQINWIYTIFLCLIWALLFSFRNYRTPSKERIETNSDIKLPADFKVIKDEYQDMWQDYGLNYEIQFDDNGTQELIKSIKVSKFYNANSLFTGIWNDSNLILINSVKAAWIKSPKGYDFGKPTGRLRYFITLDTLTNKLTYNEGYD